MSEFGYDEMDEETPIQDAVNEVDGSVNPDISEDETPEGEHDVDASTHEDAINEEPEVEAPKPPTEKEIDEQLLDKTNRAARLLRVRRAILSREQEEKSGKTSTLVRALRLLQLKPKMEQKEISDLLGVRLRDLDAMFAEAEKKDLVGRIEPEEPDMRKIVVFAEDDAVERAEIEDRKAERLVPGLTPEAYAQILALLDQVIDLLVALGLDEPRDEHGPHHDDRGPRGGGFGGPRHDERGPRGGGYGHRDDRGPRGGGYGHRDDRGPRGGGYGHHDDRGPRGGGFGGPRHDDRGPRNGGGYGSRDDRGGQRGGYGSRGGYGHHDDRGPRNGVGYGSRGGYGHRDDRGPRGGGYGSRDSR